MSPGSVPQAVLFDVGLTLVHPDGRMLSSALRQCGVDGVEPADAIAAFQMSCDATHMRLPASLSNEERLGWAFSAALAVPPEAGVAAVQACMADTDFYNALDEHAHEALAALQGLGIRLAVVSNSDGTLLDELERFGIGVYFEVVVDSTLVGAWKPHPSIFNLACDQLGVTPSDCWYVGDDVINDVIGGLAAGFGTTVLYDRFDLYQHIPGVSRVLTLRDLPELVRSADAAPRVVSHVP